MALNSEEFVVVYLHVRKSSTLINRVNKRLGFGEKGNLKSNPNGQRAGQ